MKDRKPTNPDHSRCNDPGQPFCDLVVDELVEGLRAAKPGERVMAFREVLKDAILEGRGFEIKMLHEDAARSVASNFLKNLNDGEPWHRRRSAEARRANPFYSA